MVNPALYETLWTASLIGVLFAATAYALSILPWTDREIARVHNAAVALMFPQAHARALARARR